MFIPSEEESKPKTEVEIVDIDKEEGDETGAVVINIDAVEDDGGDSESKSKSLLLP